MISILPAFRTIAALALIACISMPAAAQEQPPPMRLAVGYAEMLNELRSLQPAPNGGELDSPDAGIQNLGLSGLVVDETVTRIGRDFYDQFFAFWEPPDSAVNLTIVIQEQPLPGLGTLVMVRVNDEMAFQVRLQPQQDEIEAAASQGVAFTARHIENRSLTVPQY